MTVLFTCTMKNLKLALTCCHSFTHSLSHRIASIFVIFMIVSSSAHSALDPITPDPLNATLVFFRTQYTGSALEAKFNIDGVQVSKSRGWFYFTLKLRPGIYGLGIETTGLISDGNQSSRSITAVAGSIQFYEVYSEGLFSKFTWFARETSEQEGYKVIKNLSLNSALVNEAAMALSNPIAIQELRGGQVKIDDSKASLPALAALSTAPNAVNTDPDGKEAKAKEEIRLLAEAKVREDARAAAEAQAREKNRLTLEAQRREDARLAAEAKAKEEIRLLAEAKVREDARLATEARAREEVRLAAESKAREIETTRIASLREQIERDRLSLIQLEKQNSSNGTKVAQQTFRKALVIGNDNYQSVTKLQNAREDARSIAKSLESVGYQVSLELDSTEKGMKQALRKFKSQVQGGDEVVIFYAGHGVQLGGSNYLIPVDVRGDSEDQIRDEAVQLQRLLDDMSERKARLTLAIVDACRDNPFASNGRVIGGRGLATTAAATGQMVIFSAGTGQQALDKLGPNDKDRNGLFTRIFVREMQRPGITVDSVLRSVRTKVVGLAQSVGHEQVPAIYDQVVGEFYFIR